MTLKINNVGEAYLLEQITNRLTGGGLDAHIHLYSNDYTPVDTSVLGHFTDSGLTPQALAGNVVTPNADAQGRASCEWDDTVWENTGSPLPVYGYYVVDTEVAGTLLWAERFADPKTLYAGGIPLHVTPQLTFRSEN